MFPTVTFSPQNWLAWLFGRQDMAAHGGDSSESAGQQDNPSQGAASDPPHSLQGGVNRQSRTRPPPLRHISIYQLGEIIERQNQEIAKLRTSSTQCEKEFARTLSQWEEAIQRERSDFCAEIDALNKRLLEKDNTIAALRKREQELSMAHEFLTSEDRCSAADVIKSVEALNYDILQVATAAAQYIGEQMAEGGDVAPIDERRPEDVEQVAPILGPRLCQVLEAGAHNDDIITLLQLAFQTALCYHCVRFIRSWDNLDFKYLSHYSTVIYKTMKAKESQPIFARWRSLTQRSIDELVSQEKLEPLSHRISRQLLEIMPAANIQHKKPESLHAFLVNKLGPIAEHIGWIRKIVTLDFISGDLDLILASAGAPFEKEAMRDGFDGSADVGWDDVVCTTELGLRMTKKVTKNGESHFEPRILLRPQVFLESSLDALMESV